MKSVAVNRLVPFAKLKSQSDFANLNSAYDCLLLEVKFSIEDFILFAMVAAGDLMLLLRGWTEEIIAISFDGVDLFCISLKLRPLIMEPFVNKVYLHEQDGKLCGVRIELGFSDASGLIRSERRVHRCVQ